MAPNPPLDGSVPRGQGQDGRVNFIPASADCFTVNGLPWFEENGREFFRLPKRAEKILSRDLWGCSLNTSGGRIRFKTDSTCLKLRIHHGGGSIYMHHFCSVGCSGIDLYVGPPEAMTYWVTNHPATIENPYICTYLENQDRQMREYTLYLPTYCNIASLEIGLDPDARVQPPSPFRLHKPIPFYGSSITQGGCSSRGGTSYVPLIGRMLGIDIINLGFSGLGRGEPEMAELLAEIDAAAYVLDCVPNMGVALMEERYDRFVDILRARRPDRPIILMNRIRYAPENFSGTKDCDRMNEIVLATYNRCRSSGDKNIHFFDAAAVIGFGPDHPSVDGCHLTDAGFKLLAEALAPVLKTILFG